jgi:septal ring-binding cell division protein DamX
MTLSIENLVISLILSIMVVIFFFTLGVERGKKIALADAVRSESAENVQAAVAPQGADEPEAEEFQDRARPSLWEGALALLKRPSQGAVNLSGDTSGKPLAADTGAVLPAGDDRSAPGQGDAVKHLTPPSSAESNYTVQVASYKSERSAKREAQNLKQKGYSDIFVLPKGAYVILCVGNFSTRNEASTYTKKLRDRYQDSVVRRL